MKSKKCFKAFFSYLKDKKLDNKIRNYKIN